MTSQPQGAGAVFSADGIYRYRLWRRWAAGAQANFLLLNPSTADADTNDATVERCVRRARRLGCGGLEVTNVFALRTPSPAGLYRVDDPVGPGNDGHVLDAAGTAGLVICGWGNHGRLRARGAAVLAMLRAHGIVPLVLDITRAGEPRHPLYLRYGLRPRCL
ncbi:DUF1643 domain-containing protein [Aquisalimonas lutea]|uniref:DUF1643 domain-containing protein n=1 Tax=Aquisalimonas lutea TaxID=1327750 RepID=UPI0025B43C21|nr:DUF1643 domain-containing protein [Aquisalimonas lutea]MDN3516509.1 DUF1643 domain-containing protein [Aquisalimonas lutea]